MKQNKARYAKQSGIKTFISIIVLINFKCYFKCVDSKFVVVDINFHDFNVLQCFIIEKKYNFNCITQIEFG